MTLLKRITTLAAAAALVGFAGVANAATCNTPQGKGLTLVQDPVDSVVDADCFAGNDTNTIDAAFEMFGETGWILGAKTDGPGGDGKVSFSIFDEFDWALSNPDGYTEIVITLKQGNGFGAFLLAALNPLSGTWFTSDDGDLSHASVYYRGDANPPGSVPVPAAGVLLVGALGGLAAVRRRRGKGRA